MQVHHGKREFNFFPHTFVLPADLKLLKRAWEDGNSKQKWIIKPVGDLFTNRLSRLKFCLLVHLIVLL